MRSSLHRFCAVAVCAGVAWCAESPVSRLAATGAATATRPNAARAASFNSQQRAAIALMARALVSIRDQRQARGIPLDRALDPNATGIVGDEFTPLTTSLGDVEAKRTAANPAFAAVVAGYFQQAGLKRGDVVAIGASGSFPALILATFSAAFALELEPLAVYSIGSSMYGANLPGFTFVDMLAGLRAEGVLPYRFVAVAPGGSRDTGRGVLFDEEGTTLVDEARRTGLPMLGGASLADNITERIRVFDVAARGRPIRCFVNVGGASANYGDTPSSLELPNGLVRHVADMPRGPTRGLVFEFAERGIPVVHLLHVRGLAATNDLPYDPVPFPPVAEERE